MFGLFYDESFGLARGLKIECLITPEILDPFMHLSRGLFWPLGMPLDLPLGIPRALEHVQGTSSGMFLDVIGYCQNVVFEFLALSMIVDRDCALVIKCDRKVLRPS